MSIEYNPKMPLKPAEVKDIFQEARDYADNLVPNAQESNLSFGKNIGAFQGYLKAGLRIAELEKENAALKARIKKASEHLFNATPTGEQQPDWYWQLLKIIAEASKMLNQ